MRKILLAELILSLVMPRDRAASIAGDLTESSRGILALSWSIVSTFFATVFRDLSVPFIAKAVGLVLLLNVTFRGAFVTILVTGGRIFEGLTWMGPILGVAFLLLAPIWIGRIVGRWLPGRELAVWFASALFMVLTIPVWSLFGAMPFWLHALLTAGHIPPASLVPLLVGLLLARRTTLRQGSRA